jgi:hypothetical protein
MFSPFWHLHCKNIKVPSCYQRDNTSEENKGYYISENSVAKISKPVMTEQ